MYFVMNNSPKNSLHQEECLPKCGICHSDISGKTFHQPSPSLPIICSNCHENFTEEEIFFMTNMFSIYGGYFAQKRSIEFSFIDSLKIIYKDKFSTQDFDELNAQVYHNALLHGISLTECSQKLNLFLDSI